MAVDFKSLLRKPVDQIERPKPIPAGTYFGSILRTEYGESTKEKTPYLRVHLQVQGPGEDVAPEDVADVDFSKKKLRRDFYLTEDALYRLADFVQSLGIPTAGRTLDEMIPEITNAAVMIHVTQRASQDGTEFYNDVDRLSGVPA